MKVHAKKKAYRVWLQGLAKSGLINNADGKMVQRTGEGNNSMMRDYYPQGGSK